MKSLNEWLEYIDTVHGKKIDLSLERIRTVAQRLELLPFKPFSIIVGGTNGKGSTSSLIAQVLTNSGYQVGSTLSPHLLRFNERIKVNMQEVSDSDIIDAFELIEQARAEITLSYFEFNTLASLYIFHKQKVEIAVLEVGLGGEFDAVNIVDANLAIITNVALDHVDLLGPNRETIGQTKAGIIRLNIPVIYGEEDMPATVQATIATKQAKLFQYGHEYKIVENAKGFNYHNASNSKEYTFKNLKLLPVNVAAAITAIEVIAETFPVSEKVLSKTVPEFSLAGRYQVEQSHKREHIFDVAHNPHSIKALNSFLENRESTGKTIAVFSMLNTKDLKASMANIQTTVDEWYFAPLQQEKSIKTLEFRAACEALQICNYQVFTNLPTAYESALQQSNSMDRIVIFGSFYTVSELLPYTQKSSHLTAKEAKN